ncbi:MAG: hypothetical protein ABS939_00755 [Psychrobacillus sp.]
MEKRKKTVMGNREFILSFFPWFAKKAFSFFSISIFTLLLYFLAVGFINILIGLKMEDSFLIPITIIGLVISFIASIVIIITE